MDAGHLEALGRLDGTYWWHAGKRALILDLLRRHFSAPGLLVEGGIGAGGNLAAFRAAGWRTLGLDVAPAAVERARSLGLGEATVHDLQRPWPVAPAAALAVVLLDCLEHLDDPVATLAEARRCLGPGGKVLATVPAYPALLGPWDRMLGHRRRYRSRTLRAEAEAAGLSVAWMSHWNAFTLPAAVLARLVERGIDRPHGPEFPALPGWANRGLRTAGAAERALLLRHPLPVGLSLVAVLVP